MSNLSATDNRSNKGVVTKKIFNQPIEVGQVTPFLSKIDQDNLPVVDIQGLYNRNPRIQRIAAGRIGEAAMSNGFLYIANHGISKELIDAVYEQGRAFFSKSLAYKNRYYVGKSSNHRGYVPVTEKGNYSDEQGARRYEAFDMGLELPSTDVDYLNGNSLLGPNVWPDLPRFKQNLSAYYSSMTRLSFTMCHAFEIVLGLPQGYFRAHMRKPTSQLRLLHYFENNDQSSNTDVNMGAHTDYECFTILHSRNPGLQILDVDGEWIDAPPIENTFYFNIGDMLEAWSGGRFVATPHRVFNNGSERFSIPFFAAADYNTAVEPVVGSNELVNEYEPVIAGEHLLRQMLRDFPYLKKRYDEKIIKLINIDSEKAGDAQSNPFENRIYESYLFN